MIGEIEIPAGWKYRVIRSVIISMLILVGWSCSEPNEPTNDVVFLQTTAFQYAPGDTIVATIMNFRTDTIRVYWCYGLVHFVLRVYSEGEWKMAMGGHEICSDLPDRIPPGGKLSLKWFLPSTENLPLGRYRLEQDVWPHHGPIIQVASNSFQIE